MDLEHVTTRRLRGEPMTLRHHALLCDYFAQPALRAALWPPPLEPPDAEGVRLMIERHAFHWRGHGFGPWLFFDPGESDLVAVGGLQRRAIDGVEELEAGWSVAPARWRQGLATEIAALQTEVAFGALRAESVVALTMRSNAGSLSVMRKLGFVYERDVEHAGLPHVLYRVRAPR